MKKYKELNTLSLQELQTEAKDLRKQLGEMVFAHAISPIENPAAIRKLRRSIAQRLTAIRAKRSLSN